MADLFVTFAAVLPKPSTVTTVGPLADKGASPNNGLFTTIQTPQVQTPGK